ncbi:MAG: hypothetical protein CMD92_01290 [Gammaproteobacteria bacterium]|nr:hypothetical protein [Gammaproteobacteria bacterium]|tara:strand:+ start:4238 stop:4534 length:297 start_codon:yes stop_codon:yes gene_type:complete
MMSKELENAILALGRLTSTSDMSVLADHFRRHQTFLGKQKGAGLKIGDTIEWEYGGLLKQGVITKNNRSTVDVTNVGNNTGFKTRTRLHKSMITRKVA